LDRPIRSAAGRVASPAVVACLVAVVSGCAATPWEGSELDPARVTFAPELSVDLAAMDRTPSGLYVQDLNEGTGPVATRTGLVSVHYVGWLPDGTVFDTSVGGDPMHFRLGGNEVIKGWNEGIPGMKVGGRRRLVVRPGLAYGSRSVGRVPSGATLVFELQLVEVR